MPLFFLSLSEAFTLSLSLSFDRKLFPLTRSLSLSLSFSRAWPKHARFFLFLSRVCVCVYVSRTRNWTYFLNCLAQLLSLSLSRTNERAKPESGEEKIPFLCEALQKKKGTRLFFKRSTRVPRIELYAYTLLCYLEPALQNLSDQNIQIRFWFCIIITRAAARLPSRAARCPSFSCLCYYCC